MADLILHKRSSTASAVPSAGSIALGELAINTADGRLFLKKGDGTVVDVTSIGGIQGLTAALAGKMTNPMTTAGDMIRGGTSGAPERVAAGANGYVWTVVAGVPGWAAAPAAPARYESAPQVITAGGLLTLAHSLGAKPTRVQGFLSCVTAEQNYSVGDECPVSLDNQGTNSLTWGASCAFDATNIYVRPSGTSGSFILLNKTTTSAFQITNANWRLIVRAEL